MVKNSDETTPLTQSPSITQETKVRFNQLLNEALSREKSIEPQLFKRSCGIIPNRQSDSVPKIVPRQKHKIKSANDDQYFEKRDNTSSVYSSEDSSGSRKVKRQVIAEVHSSRTQLLLSSSDDDILSEKKEKSKKKISGKKQVTGLSHIQKEQKGQENYSFQGDEEVERSSSRLSNRSYVVETPTFHEDNLKLLTSETKIQESPIYQVDKPNSCSPSRLSNRSYTIETPTFPLESVSTDEPVLPKIKPPMPLPRSKSLKSIDGIANGSERTKSPVACDADSQVGHEQSCTIITINDTVSHGSEDDIDVSKGSTVIKLQDSAYTEDENFSLSVRKQKRKKKRKKHVKSLEDMEMQEFMAKGDYKEIDSRKKQTPTTSKSSIKEVDSQSARQSSPAGEQIVGVTVHCLDCSLVHPLVRHPVVRLYIIDTSTGEYFKKSDVNRSVCYYDENTSYIQPIMTHPFDFKQQRTVTPVWEECLLLNESFSHLFTPSTLLLFEVCDFVSSAIASAHYDRLGSAAVWHIVAWAFLRPVASCGALNIANRLRLQLFKPGKPPKSCRNLSPAVYEWWGTAARHKYTGCLYVTVSAVDSPTTPFSPRLRSRLALQAEVGSVSSVRSTSAAGSDFNSDDNREQQEEMKAETVVWSRLAAQSCKLPNTKMFNLPVDGSMCLKFSGNGLWLACAKQEIYIYSVPQFQHTVTLTGHQGLVYSVSWSADSKVLLSSSADSTVCIWKPHHRKAPLLQMLAHPSFVYCAQFIKTSGCVTLITGCYDGMLRLWQGDTHTSYQLRQELVGHPGFVSSICVTVDNSKIISADSQGILRIYTLDEDGSLTAGRELRVREVRGTTISNIVAHPGGHRLLVHSRDSTVYSVDIATGAVIQTFKGCSNDKMQTGMCVSPCGSLVFACGEDGVLTAWDAHTGVLRAIYCGLLPPGSAAVDYHPYEHMLALASLVQSPVYVLTFDRSATGKEIGLHVIGNEITAAEVIEKMKTIQSTNKWQKAVSKVIPHSSQSSILVHDSGIIKDKNKKVKKEEKIDTQTQSTKWPSIHQLDTFMEKSCSDKDLRILEIIRKMDSIILAAKQSSQT